MQMMTHFLYILLLLLVMSCGGKNPLRYNIKSSENNPYHHFNIEYGIVPHDSFPLHYAAEEDTLNKDEFSYFFIRNEGDTVVWEEGTIKTP